MTFAGAAEYLTGTITRSRKELHASNITYVLNDADELDCSESSQMTLKAVKTAFR